MKTVTINEKQFEVVKDYKDALDLEEVSSKLTDYFDDFDYIVGDWAYNKLRLKGFYEPNSPKVKPYNNIKNVDNYFLKSCAYDCRIFIIKKLL